jgi:hypothetical protein
MAECNRELAEIEAQLDSPRETLHERELYKQKLARISKIDTVGVVSP